MNYMALYRVFTTVADIFEKPDSSHNIGRRESQMLFGEGFEAEKEYGNWLYGRSETDGYEGWVEKSHLRAQSTAPTHFTNIAWTHIYPEPSFKTRPVIGLSMLSRITIDHKEAEQDGFVRIPALGWIFARHVKPLTDLNSAPAAADPVDTAMHFLHSPYLYSGRSALGIDCSGLIQIALLRAGIKTVPRDSDQQERALPHNVTEKELRRGDIVFFPGHVGIMVDEKNILNATARHMRVLIEPLETVTKANGKITAIKRPVA